MAFEPQTEFEPAEELVAALDVSFDRKANRRFVLVLTNRAAYWPGKKLFGIWDDVITVRVPLREIRRVEITRASGVVVALWGVAACLAGLAIVWLAVDGESYEPDAVGYGLALAMGGICFGLLGGRRRRVTIETGSRRLSFTEPISLGGDARVRFAGALDEVHGWARTHGLRLLDRRPRRRPGPRATPQSP
jgi:hypothetical protein